MDNKGCSFTGHRDVSAEHKKALPGLLMRAIEYAYNLGCRDFYAGGAVGFDTFAAREVIRFRLSHRDARLVLLLPCINQNELWSGADTDAYEYVLSEADEIKYVAEEYTKSCMQKRNQALADSCDIMIAYVGRPRSGAGQTVRMAEKLGKKVYNLYFALEKEKGKEVKN